jgi:aspartokinase-like uncharacterized kinase
VTRAPTPRHQPNATQGRASPVTVVKLGGSLAESADLTSWLDRLAAIPGRLVIVPGGGPFADQVRKAQARWGFDEATAHHLAILAMEQFGRMLCGLQPALYAAASHAAMDEAWADGRLPLWLPTAMTMGRPEIPESWAVTSDSLAAWLAGTIGAGALVLVKSADPPPGPLVAADLARRGLVDPAFPEFLEKAGCVAWYLGSGAAGHFAQALGAGAPLGVPIGA